MRESTHMMAGEADPQTARAAVGGVLARAIVGDDALVVSYGSGRVEPTEIHTVPYTDPTTYINDVAALTTSLVESCGGTVPADVIRELVANLIHASFTAPVVSVLENGCTVRVADAGPGIGEPALAVEPGYTSATVASRSVIRGIGAGLGTAASSLRALGGRLLITNNAGSGAVVTASVPQGALPSTPSPTPPSPTADATPPDQPSHAATATRADSAAAKGVAVSMRQREVLAVVADGLEAGPSTVADSLGISLSTAHRDLLFLEKRGLVAVLGSGKRQVTALGLEVLRIY